MLNPSFSENLAQSGFAHRANFQADGSVVYRLADGTGSVRVRNADWQRLGEDFSQSMTPIRRRTRMLTVALLPMTFVFGMTLGQFLPYSGFLILAAIFLGPLAIYLRHSSQVRTCSARMEGELLTYARCAPAVQTSGREARWFEIAFMVFVGPHLVLATVGEIGGPDFFRETPLWGAGIGPFEAVAFVCVALRLVLPRIAGRLSSPLRQ